VAKLARTFASQPPSDYFELPWLFLADWPLDKMGAGTTTPTLAVGTVDS